MNPKIRNLIALPRIAASLAEMLNRQTSYPGSLGIIVGCWYCVIDLAGNQAADVQLVNPIKSHHEAILRNRRIKSVGAYGRGLPRRRALPTPSTIVRGKLKVQSSMNCIIDAGSSEKRLGSKRFEGC